MRRVLICLITLTIPSVSYGQQAPLNSLYELQAGDFTEITSFWYTEGGKLTFPRLADMHTETHKINRTRRDREVVYFDYIEVTDFPSSDKTFAYQFMLRSTDGQTMQKLSKYRLDQGWQAEDAAKITTTLGETDSTIYETVKGNENWREHHFAVTWAAIKRIVHTDAYEEIRSRLGGCTDCTLALAVDEFEDFFGATYDTTGIVIYRPGFWWSAGARGEYGWIGFKRSILMDSGPFTIHRIRIHTKSRLQGKDR